MERKRTAPSAKALEVQDESGVVNDSVEVMSVAQIQGLVRLLDRSDVSELEVKRASEGVHLVLRKTKAPDGQVSAGEAFSVASGNSMTSTSEARPATVTTQAVKAPLVGIFHPWLKPRGGTLAAVGDRVKVGQLLGTIESLNVLNEVEATVAGRVTEVHVQDGQPVEYGQALITLDCSEIEEA
jgi:biotin carboxyl carrier protein